MIKLSGIFKKLTRKIILAILAVIVLGIPLLYLTVLNQKEAAAWFSEQWLYRTPLTITHNAEVLNNKVKFDIDTAALITAGKMQSDCGDSRFTDANGKLLKYYLDSSGGACNTNSTDYYVLVPKVLNGTTTIYHYYGNPSAPDGTQSVQFSEDTLTPSTGISAGSEAQGPGPVLYWGFDDGQGTAAQDSSSSNIDGTLNNTPVWQPEDRCIAGKCLYFDGTNNENVSLADNSKLDFGATGNFTVSAWVKRNGASSAINYIISKHDITDDTEDGGYKLYTDASGDLCFGIDDDITWGPDISACTSAVDFDDDKWHYVAGVRDQTGTDKIYLYVDGNQRASTADSTTATLANSNTFYVGVDRDGTSNEWKGFIDEVKIYPYARSAAQIKTDFAQGTSGQGGNQGTSANLGSKPQEYLSEGLVGYWKMDESSGNTVDSSGNSLTLTNNGTATFASGKFGSASVYDGSTKYFNTATAINGIKTVSFWVNTADTDNYFVNLINSSAYITSSSGTVSATGFTSPSVYVNGILNGAVAASAWNLVTITTDTGVDADAFAVGLTNDGSDHYLTNNSKIDEVRLYNRALSPKEISDLYNWAPGPVGYWKMDDKVAGDSKTIVDLSGNGNNGTTVDGANNTGMDCSKSGKYGGGCQFDSDDSISIGTPASLNNLPQGDFTAETWAKADTITGNGSNYLTLGLKSSKWTAKIYYNGASSYLWSYVVLPGGSDSDYRCTFNASSGTWNHFTTVYTASTKTARLYYNGQPLTSCTAAQQGTGTYTSDSSTSMSIAGQGMTGNLDDLKIYNYARTQKQIVSDMNAGHPAVGSPVGSAVAHWKMDEGYGTSANDSTPNANTLTLSSASWTNAGKFGKAWNGTNAVWLSRTDDSDFDVTATDDYAVSLWFKSDSADNPGAIEYLFNKASAVIAGYAVYANTDGTVCFGIDDDTTWGPDVSSCTSSDIYDGAWHHLVAVRDTVADKTLIYTDGVLRDSDTDSTTATLANSLSLYLGDRDGTNNGDEFTGDLDEVKVYRYALTADEVKVEYNRGSSLVLGSAGDNSSYAAGAANQEYCIPGDTSTCTAPVGRWDFEEGTGVTANDSSGNGKAGTLTGSAAWGLGKFGKSVKLNGTTAYVNPTGINGLGSLVNQGSFTVSVWARTELANTRQAIFSDYDASGGGNSKTITLEFGLLGLPSNHIAVNVVAPTSTNIDSNFVYSANTWYYITVTYNSSTGILIIYVNGVQQNSKTGLSSLGAGTKLSFGRAGAFNGIYLKGQVDDVRIFNYVRTPAQIAWDYNRGAPVGHWKLDECQGATAYDSSGNNNNGTITIGASGEDTLGTCTTSSTAWGSGATGKRNASLKFDGTDDYTSITDIANLRFNNSTDDFSLFAWVKRSTTGTEYIIGKEDADNDGYRLLFTSSNTVQCSEDSTDVTSTSTITDTNWHLIGCTIDRDGNGQIYIDGKPDGSAVSMGTDTMATTANITIGTRSYTAANYFNGQIDDVRIYNYALTAAQVKDIYNQGAVFFGPAAGPP